MEIYKTTRNRRDDLGLIIHCLSKWKKKKRSGRQLMQLVSSKFKGTTGHITPLNLSCWSPYYMAFRILKCFTHVCSRGQLPTLQEKMFKGNKYQGTTSGSKTSKTDITGGRQNIQWFLHSSALHCAFGKQPLKIQETGYKAKGILGLPRHWYFRFTMLFKRETCKKIEMTIDQCWFKIFFLLQNKLDSIWLVSVVLSSLVSNWQT